MAEATSKRPTGVTQEWIDAVKKRLSELPPPPPPVKRYTRQEAIIELAPVILDMRKRHYRIEDILPVLNAGGQSFTAAALKTYLARAPSTPSSGAPKPLRRAKTAAGVSSATMSAPAPATAASSAAASPGARLRAPVPDGEHL